MKLAAVLNLLCCHKQDAEGNEEKEETHQSGETSKETEVPPNIPPLPQSHLQAQRARTPEKGSSVAKIISQFQEAANISNVNVVFCAISTSSVTSFLMFLLDSVVCKLTKQFLL